MNEGYKDESDFLQLRLCLYPCPLSTEVYLLKPVDQRPTWYCRFVFIHHTVIVIQPHTHRIGNKQRRKENYPVPNQETRSIPANQSETLLLSGASGNLHPTHAISFVVDHPISHQMPSKARHPGFSGSLSGGSRFAGNPPAPENGLFYEKTLLYWTEKQPTPTIFES